MTTAMGAAEPIFHAARAAPRLAEAPAPSLSVIIPAYNAEATLAQTLDCLAAQTRADWEAIVVDDGSTDATAAVAMAYAGREPRVRCVRQPNGGVSAARNRGIERAAGAWLLFLDADDWVAPDYVAKMLAAATRRRDASAIFCGYNRVTPDGTRLPQDWYEDISQAPFESFARGCPPAIHSVIARRKLVAEVGGFDPSLVTCEDWDLWQKIARAGARFVEVPETLAFYRTQAGSLSTRTVQMLRDGFLVSARAWGPDPRVPNPSPRHADGYWSEKSDGTRGYLICWCAGELAAGGQESDVLFEALAELPRMRERTADMVDAAFSGMLIGCEGRVETVIARWPELAPRLGRFFARLETELGRAGLKRRGMQGLRARMTYEAVPGRPQTATAAMPLTAIAPIATPSATDTVNLRLQLAGDEWASVHVPAWGDLSEADVVQAAADTIQIRRLLGRSSLARSPRLWWSVLRKSVGAAEPLARALLPGDIGRKGRLKAAAARVLREAVAEAGGKGSNALAARAAMAEIEQRAPAPHVAAPVAPDAPDPLDGLDPTADPKAYFETLFEAEDPWDYTNAYETLKYRQTLGLVPEGPIGRAMEVACAEGHFTALLAPKVRELLAVDISSKALGRAAQRCSAFDNVAYRQFNLVTDAFPEGLDLMVCSEVLYYLGGEAQLRVVAGRMAGALAPGGRLLTAHAFQLSDDPSKTGFDWGDPYGAETISRVFGATEGLTLERSIVTELYRIDLFRRGGAGAAAPAIERAEIAKPLDEGVERHVVWGGAVERRADLARSRRTFKVPVLMYHRIADEGPAPLADYRVAPAAFAEQLRLLRQHGFHAVTPDELIAAYRRGKPLTGRPVMITFDDGYQDFADAAWPLLKRSDFTAHVFLVSSLVGERSHWDAEHGPTAPLMDWSTIRALAAEGVSFGSHMATHRAADALASNELLEEAYGSRLRLEAELAVPIRSVAAPFGVYDDRLLYILRLCGYDTAFTTDEGMASILDDPWCLPRIEVSGGMDISAFAEAVGLDGDE